jgi:hypothetical protein
MTFVAELKGRNVIRMAGSDVMSLPLMLVTPALRLAQDRLGGAEAGVRFLISAHA